MLHIGDSVVILDKIIEETRTISTKSTYTNFYILQALLLITIAIYLTKHQSKQKHLPPYHDASKLKGTGYANIS